jgi:hypothetical protein
LQDKHFQRDFVIGRDIDIEGAAEWIIRSQVVFDIGGVHGVVEVGSDDAGDIGVSRVSPSEASSFGRASGVSVFASLGLDAPSAEVVGHAGRAVAVRAARVLTAVTADVHSSDAVVGVESHDFLSAIGVLGSDEDGVDAFGVADDDVGAKVVQRKVANGETVSAASVPVPSRLDNSIWEDEVSISSIIGNHDRQA